MLSTSYGAPTFVAPMFPATLRYSVILKRIAITCAMVGIIGGLLILTGWVTEIPQLTDWLGSGISMMPNAAIATSLAGLALWLRAQGHDSRSWVCAAISGSIGLATFIQHIFHVDLGIDQFLLKVEWGQRGTTSPGRMGLPASFMFFLLSASIVFAAFGTKGRKIASRGAAICIGISLLSVIGYLYEADSLYIIPELTAISITTALILILLSIGLFCTLYDVQPMHTLLESSAAGAIVRRALPILILVPIVIGWLRLKGQQMALYDISFGIALGTIIQLCLLMILLWWMAAAVSRHERSQQESEAALRDSEQRYHSFIQHSSEGIWRCELSRPLDISLPVDEQLDHIYGTGTLEECNDAMARMYGFKRGSELVGTRLEDLLPRTPENEEYLRTFIRSGYDLLGGESQELDREGQVIHFSNNLVGIIENGFVLRAWGTQQDITERKRTEQALIEADKRKDEFLATLAHELRNPLSPLVSGLELLSSGYAMDREGSKELHEMMQRQLQHMVRLIDDLMDVSRINRGKIALRFEELDLAHILKMALESTQPLIEQSDHMVRLEAPQGSLIVKGDVVRLTQVFQNLLNNAAKYTTRGGEILVRATRANDHVIVSVKDNGIGLEPEHFHSIFDMFGQVDRSPGRNYSGLGIGLALVKRLVEDHGGTVAATSEGLGKGTTLIVSLPLYVQNELEFIDRRAS